MFHPDHQGISDDGDIDLPIHGILRGAPELLDSDVLLQQLEEQLNLPTILVERSDQQSFKV